LREADGGGGSALEIAEVVGGVKEMERGSEVAGMARWSSVVAFRLFCR
jgi:hypothetical protein